MKKIAEFNQDYQQASTELFHCCGCKNWVSKVMQYFPFADVESLCQAAEKQWFALEKKDWLEAFQSHPQIGVKKVDNQKLGTKTHLQWSKKEQQGVQDADQLVLEKLQDLNQEYFQKFGFIFIVCATGKSAEQMLEILEARAKNSYLSELKTAAIEQNKIILIRIKKIIL